MHLEKKKKKRHMGLISEIKKRCILWEINYVQYVCWCAYTQMHTHMLVEKREI